MNLWLKLNVDVYLTLQQLLMIMSATSRIKLGLAFLIPVLIIRAQTMTNLITSSSKFAASESLAYATYVNDGNLYNEFYVSTSATKVGSYLQVDLGTSQNVETIYMYQYQYSNLEVPSDVEIYLGDSPASGKIYSGVGTPCYNGGMEGIAKCSGKGRYLIFRVPKQGNSFRFGELFAWNQISYSAVLALNDVVGLTRNTVYGSLDRMLGASDNFEPCTWFELAAGATAYSLTFTMDTASDIDYAFVTLGAQHTVLGVQFELSDGINSPTLCPKLSFSKSVAKAASVFCQQKAVTFVKAILTPDPTWGARDICKFAFFGSTCPSPAVFTEPASFSADIPFNLLAATSQSINLPSLTISNDKCFQPTWKLGQSSDDKDMIVALPAVFAFSSANVLQVNPVLNDYAARKSLFGKQSLYFQGTMNDTPQTQTKKFTFDIDFQDPCRSATVTPQTIGSFDVDLHGAAAQTSTVKAFQDSVDASGAYTVGACGEKVLTFTNGPAYLAVTAVLNPIANSLKITFDKTKAALSDYGTHTIDYEVNFKEYTGIAAALKGSFQLTIKDDCRTATIQSQTISSLVVNWLADPTKTLSVPAFTDSVDAAMMVINGYGTCGEKVVSLVNAPAYLSISAGKVPITDPLTITYTKALATKEAFGQTQISYSVSFKNYAGIAPSVASFTFEMTDPCRSATVTPQTIGSFAVDLHGAAAQTSTVKAFQDSVDASGAYTVGACGEKVLTFTNGPAYLAVTAGPNPITDPLQITFDKTKAALSDFGTRTINYEVNFKEYTGIAPALKGSFQLTIKDDCRTATIQSQTISSLVVNWLADPTKTLSVPAFTDTVDAAMMVINGYGTCGEKVVSLVNAPAYLSISAGKVPITDPLTITYTKALATKEAFGQTQISYSVSFKNYAGIAPSVASFTFEMTDPCRSATVTPQTIGSFAVDLHGAAAQTSTVKAFQDSVDASGAYTVGACGEKVLTFTNGPAYLAVTAGPNPIADPLKITFDKTKAAISDFGTRTINYSVSFKEYTGIAPALKGNFQLTIKDECRNATINNQTITFPTVDWSSDATKTVSVPAFTDSVDAKGVYQKGVCGEKQLVFSKAPACLSVKPGTDPINSSLTITYEKSAANVSDVGSQTIAYSVQLKNYVGIAASLASQSFTLNIVCPLSTSLTTTISAAQNFDISLGKALQIPLPVVQVGPPGCHSLSSFVVLDKQTQLAAPFVKVSSTAVEILTSDKSLTGQTYTLTVSAVTEKGTKVHPQDFTVTMIDSCTSTILVPHHTTNNLDLSAFAGSSQPLSYSFKAYTDSVSDSNGRANLCGNITYTLLDAPSIVTIKELTVSLDTSKVKAAESFSLVLVAKLKDYQAVPQAEFKFTVTIRAPIVATNTTSAWNNPLVNPPPPIQTPRPPLQPPEVVENKPVAEVSKDAAVGGHSDTVAGPKENAKSQSEVYVVAEQDAYAQRVRASVNPNQLAAPDPVPFLKASSASGSLAVSFTQPLKQIWPKTDFKYLKFPSRASRNLQQSAAIDLSLLLDGDDSVYWTNSITVEIEASDDQDIERVKMDWSVTEVTPQRLMIQLDFEDPRYISFTKADTVVITFHDENLFISEDGIKIRQSNSVIRHELKRMLPKDESSLSLQQIISSVAENSKFAFFFVFTLNWLLSFSLNQLLGVVNALQLLIFLPLFEVYMPANASLFFGKLTELVVFDAYDINDYLFEYLQLKPSDPLNNKYDSVGLSTLYFINNVGSFILVIVFYLIAVVVWICNYLVTCLCPCRCSRRLSRWLANKLFWNTIGIVVIESYFVVALCSMLTFGFKFELSTDWGSQVQTVSAIVCFVLFMATPLVLLACVLVWFDNAETTEMKRRLGVFYENLNVANGRKVLMEPLVFLGRRFWLASLIVYGAQVTISQMAQFFLMTLLSTMTTYQFETLKDAHQRRDQLWNEAVILGTSYTFLIFNVVTLEQNFVIGYVSIGIVTLYIAISLLVMLISTVLQMRIKLRLWCFKRQYRRSRALKQEALQKTRKKRIEQRLSKHLALQLEAAESEGSYQLDDSSETISAVASQESARPESKLIGVIQEVSSDQESSGSSESLSDRIGDAESFCSEEQQDVASAVLVCASSADHQEQEESKLVLIDTSGNSKPRSREVEFKHPPPPPRKPRFEQLLEAEKARCASKIDSQLESLELEVAQELGEDLEISLDNTDHQDASTTRVISNDLRASVQAKQSFNEILKSYKEAVDSACQSDVFPSQRNSVSDREQTFKILSEPAASADQKVGSELRKSIQKNQVSAFSVRDQLEEMQRKPKRQPIATQNEATDQTMKEGKKMAERWFEQRKQQQMRFD